MNGTNQSADRLARATAYACEKHAGATRDDGITPYAVHPVRVTEYLRRYCNERDENVLCAALLHDTIEDAAVTWDDIAREFGDDVANLVVELTNDNRLPKAARRKQMLDHLPQLSPRAKRIKLADRLDNVTDLLRGAGTAEKRERYFAETEILLERLAGASEPLETAIREALTLLQAAHTR
jgi:GTP diphosphokinase / guanosine-3',5'-bis(diphosphate) 3'-diphosphatase